MKNSYCSSRLDFFYRDGFFVIRGHQSFINSFVDYLQIKRPAYNELPLNLICTDYGNPCSVILHPLEVARILASERRTIAAWLLQSRRRRIRDLDRLNADLTRVAELYSSNQLASR